MKKNFFVLLLASTLTISGCGNSDSASDTIDNTVSSKATTEILEDVTVENDETSQTEESKSISDFEEITVIDNEECIVKITGIDSKGLMGYTLKTYLENKSSEKTYMFSVTTAAINGVQCDPFFATEVAAEKKSIPNTD